MSKAGAQLVRYALEQLGIGHTFGMVGSQNAPIYDQLSRSKALKTHRVNFDISAAFMADAVNVCVPIRLVSC